MDPLHYKYYYYGGYCFIILCITRTTTYSKSLLL
jgi:hypothetical protein